MRPIEKAGRAQAGWVRPRKWGAIAAATFVDFEYELEPAFIENQRQFLSIFLHANLGDIQEAAKVARSMSPGSRSVGALESRREPRTKGPGGSSHEAGC